MCYHCSWSRLKRLGQRTCYYESQAGNVFPILKLRHRRQSALQRYRVRRGCRRFVLELQTLQYFCSGMKAHTATSMHGQRLRVVTNARLYPSPVTRQIGQTQPSPVTRHPSRRQPDLPTASHRVSTCHSPNTICHTLAHMSPCAVTLVLVPVSVDHLELRPARVHKTWGSPACQAVKQRHPGHSTAYRHSIAALAASPTSAVAD